MSNWLTESGYDQQMSRGNIDDDYQFMNHKVLGEGLEGEDGAKGTDNIGPSVLALASSLDFGIHFLARVLENNAKVLDDRLSGIEYELRELRDK